MMKALRNITTLWALIGVCIVSLVSGTAIRGNAAENRVLYQPVTPWGSPVSYNYRRPGNDTMADSYDRQWFPSKPDLRGFFKSLLKIEKWVSVDGGLTFEEADEPPGPSVPMGYPVYFKLVIKNKSLFRLVNITLDDQVDLLGDCNIPHTLRPGQSFEYEIGPVYPDGQGQYENTVTVTGKCFKKGFITFKDCATAYYYVSAPPEPSYVFKKYIKDPDVYPPQYVDADSEDEAVVVDPNDILTFRYVVSNFGNVPIKWESLQDDSIPIPCQLPMIIDPNRIGFCEITREAEASPGGTKNIGKAFVKDLGEQTDPAWYKTRGEAGYCTYTQGGWGSKPAGQNPGRILANCFDTVYDPNIPEFVEVGDPNNYSMVFTSAEAIRAYLPAGGDPNSLDKDYTNPTANNSSGVFGGQVLALQLNVDFKSRGTDCMEGNDLGDLYLCNYDTDLDGMTVAEILAMANDALGGGGLPEEFSSFSQLNDLVDELNKSYDNCVKSTWAMNHLFSEPCEE
ncbi:MAG: hypothetical protein ACMUIA_05110 [bacterium]